MSIVSTPSRSSYAPISDEATSSWLISLRWCAIAAQIVVIGFVLGIYQLTLPLLPIALTMLCTVASNLYFARHRPLTSKEIGIILLLDTASLTSLLYFTGGPENPFSIMYPVHVVMAGVLLGTYWTWAMTALSVVCFGALFPLHQPIIAAGAHHHGMTGRMDLDHLAVAGRQQRSGVWIDRQPLTHHLAGEGWIGHIGQRQWPGICQ